ncbi:MAG: RNase adapter RapZ [Deltaproteobacteria bacterium]|nr:RNase adapter RapZ [Deltaproteobacteria bacterium]
MAEDLKSYFNIVLISGISGSGKSSALKILEDKGFFCVDNMPVLLLPKFLEVVFAARIKNILFVIDIREKNFLSGLEEYIRFLKDKSNFFKFIFFDARDDAVVKRYSESRRKHPLSEEKSIHESIKKERSLLENIKKLSDVIIDTSDIPIHELNSIILPHIEHIGNSHIFSVRIISFGFKFGIPLESDTLFDARFLPNPFFIPSLKDFTGLNENVACYLRQFEETNIFLKYIYDFLVFYLPLYKKENKSYFTAAVGCTGGVHRSVFMVNELKSMLSEENEAYNISYFHRDIDKI